MAIPSDAQIRDVTIHPGNYDLGVKDGQPEIREKGRGSAPTKGISQEAQRAGEIVLKNLSSTPNDPYLKACAQLIVSKEHEGEVSAELKNRLQAILIPPSAKRPVHIPRAAAEGETEVKVRRELDDGPDEELPTSKPSLTRTSHNDRLRKPTPPSNPGRTPPSHPSAPPSRPARSSATPPRASRKEAPTVPNPKTLSQPPVKKQQNTDTQKKDGSAT